MKEAQKGAQKAPQTVAKKAAWTAQLMASPRDALKVVQRDAPKVP